MLNGCYLLCFVCLFFKQAELQEVSYVYAVVTQGRNDNTYPFWLTSYKVKYSMDGVTFQMVENDQGPIVNITIIINASTHQTRYICNIASYIVIICSNGASRIYFRFVDNFEYFNVRVDGGIFFYQKVKIFVIYYNWSPCFIN